MALATQVVYAPQAGAGWGTLSSLSCPRIAFWQSGEIRKEAFWMNELLHGRWREWGCIHEKRGQEKAK